MPAFTVLVRDPLAKPVHVCLFGCYVWCVCRFVVFVSLFVVFLSLYVSCVCFFVSLLCICLYVYLLHLLLNQEWVQIKPAGLKPAFLCSIPLAKPGHVCLLACLFVCFVFACMYVCCFCFLIFMKNGCRSSLRGSNPCSYAGPP